MSSSPVASGAAPVSATVRWRPLRLAVLVLALDGGRVAFAAGVEGAAPADPLPSTTGVAALDGKRGAAPHAARSEGGRPDALRPRWIAPLRARPEEASRRPPPRREARPGGRVQATVPGAGERVGPDAALGEKAVLDTDAALDTDAGDGGVATTNGPWTDARIVIHGERADARLVDLIDDTLRALGARDVERRVVAVGPANDQVRYFHAPDAVAAGALSAALEPVFGEVRVHDLTHYRPAPDGGLLELWLRHLDGGKVTASIGSSDRAAERPR